MKNKIIHLIASIVCFGVPILLSYHGLADITIGAILNASYLWASNKMNPTVSAVA